MYTHFSTYPGRNGVTGLLCACFKHIIARQFLTWLTQFANYPTNARELSFSYCRQHLLVSVFFMFAFLEVVWSYCIVVLMCILLVLCVFSHTSKQFADTGRILVLTPASWGELRSRSRRLRVQSHKTTPHPNSDAIRKSRWSPVLLTDCL